MAKRRMISIALVESNKFIEMSKGAQSLYLHCVACADDDGVIEVKRTLRTVNGRKTQLEELYNNGFLTPIEQCSDIAWVTDWQSFNSIQTTHGRASIYRKTLQAQIPNIKFVEFTGKDGNICEHNDNTVKYSLVKGSINQSSVSKVKKETVYDEQTEKPELTELTEQTELTTSCLENTFDGTPDYTVPPVREKVFSIFRTRVFYNDTNNVDTDNYTDKFLNLCERNDYKYIKQLGLEKALQGFIKQEAKYNKSVYDRFMAWTPETKVRKTKEEQEEENKKQNYAEAKKLMQRPDFNDLEERYYKAKRLDYGTIADIDVAYSLITEYDILNSTEKLDTECEYSQKQENILIRQMEKHKKTIDDYANMPGYDEFCKSIKEACEILGKEFTNETILFYCEQAYYKKGYSDFHSASKSLDSHNIIKRYEMPDYIQYQTYSEYEPEGYENLPFE